MSGEVVEGGGEGVAVPGEQRGPVGEVATGQGGGVCEVGQAGAGVDGEMVAQPPGLVAQRAVHVSGEQDGVRSRVRAGTGVVLGVAAGGRRKSGGVGQHEVAVGAAHAEGADAGEHGVVVAVLRGEVDGGVGDTEAEGVQRDRGVGVAVVEAGRQGALAQAEGGLEEAGDARGAFEVSDVGLDGADQQGEASGWARPMTAPSADASMGSPTVVPVPCSSTKRTCAGSTPAFS